MSGNTPFVSNIAAIPKDDSDNEIDVGDLDFNQPSQPSMQSLHLSDLNTSGVSGDGANTSGESGNFDSFSWGNNTSGSMMFGNNTIGLTGIQKLLIVFHHQHMCYIIRIQMVQNNI